ncbi:hypothetical protein L208DRAFT_71323 [Tricholoma matsutake]|nr:hypothetical protein L208DRAFT_71323 [Tricholoma matsutake 945]
MAHPARIVVHAVAVSVMTYGYVSLSSLPDDTWVRNQAGGRSQFLTIQGLGLAWTTMIVSLVVDLLPTIAVFRTIKRILLIMALPLSVVVSSIYWTLILFCPTAVLLRTPHPTLDDSVLYQPPLSVDLAIHACPVLALLTDFLLFETTYDRKAMANAPYVISLFAVWYGTWVEHCAKNNNDIFPYPFLTENSLKHRLMIYIGAALLGYTAFWTINTFHGRSRRI